MEIKFAINASVGIKNIDDILKGIEDQVKLALMGKYYGSDLMEIYIGWIYVSPEYDSFFKPRRPKFYESEQITIDGKKHELIKALECEIKLNYQVIKKETDTRIKLLVWNELLRSLTVNIMSVKKIKNFNTAKMIDDLKLSYKL
jgi:hypothetical protein